MYRSEETFLLQSITIDASEPRGPLSRFETRGSTETTISHLMPLQTATKTLLKDFHSFLCLSSACYTYYNMRLYH
jgi:hypothetical protein